MVAVANSTAAILIQKLSGAGGLSDAEQDGLRGLPVAVRTVAARQDILRDGDATGSCCILLDGWTCCYQMLNGGRRPILAIHVPGDLPDLQSLHLPEPDFGMVALTPATLGFVPHAAVRRLMEAFPNLAAAFWREALILAAIQRAWMAGLSRRDARGRLAHLCCELYLRLSSTGRTDGPAMPMPLRQHDLADALGLTPVHVNRTLKDLRDAGLISLHGRRLEILDWLGLRLAAEFDDQYLHLNSAEHAFA
ncbi:Crp/Fnr family transcriptional regulator [Methylobacterium sp. NEAU K]|uniref:Crp/Fnr family transcriptional regulator n=1 Tax=Methylobacterium sp. NEAU K TaxID=3064946 RepID=UPI00273289A8|nr:Crp/Fnr family transcriptional regulator [Methylobacterium sp. NEAU K]MDP4002320.1 Crp/Fnr family transcriptional regulator [Methylobacterium sp. NEAU K]